MGYIDLEFGQIHGSYRRDFVPVEAGLLIFDKGEDSIHLHVSSFEYNGDLVMRMNSIDSLGNPIGLRERLFNPARKKWSEFHPGYRIEREERAELELDVSMAFDQLHRFMVLSCGTLSVGGYVFYGGQEDLNLIRRSGFRIDRYPVTDVQSILKDHIGSDISLDKASIVMDFSSNDNTIRSEHFSYQVPSHMGPEIVPHNALGDVSRTFLLHRELTDHCGEIIHSCREHLRVIESYRRNREEIPIFQ